MIFARGSRLPDAVRERAGVERGGQVLAWTGDDEHGWMVATKRTLVIVGSQGTTTIPWDRVEHASWDRDSETLRVEEVGDFGSHRATHVVPVSVPGDFLAVLRERVTSTLVLQQPLTTPDGKPFTIVVRRSPSDRSVRAFVEYGPATDPEDPVVLSAVEEALRQVSWEIGTDL